MANLHATDEATIVGRPREPLKWRNGARAAAERRARERLRFVVERE